MLQRLGAGAFVALLLPCMAPCFAACSASGSTDAAGPSDGSFFGGDDAEAGSVQTEYDSGPPATVGDDQADSGSHPDSGGGDAGPPPGTCNSLSDCSSLGSKPGVAGVACTNKACVITCDATDYDVDGDPTNGCEVPDPTDDHDNATAIDQGGPFGCNDGATAQNILGILASDHAQHNPNPNGWDAVTGSAPDYFKIRTDAPVVGCDNDANFAVQFDVSTKQKGCYELHLDTDKKGEQMCTTDLTGHCSITNGSGSFSNQSTIYVWVVKTAACTADKFPDDAPYAITGHL